MYSYYQLVLFSGWQQVRHRARDGLTNSHSKSNSNNKEPLTGGQHLAVFTIVAGCIICEKGNGGE